MESGWLWCKDEIKIYIWSNCPFIQWDWTSLCDVTAADWSSRWTCLLPVSQWFKLIWDLFSLHRWSNCRHLRRLVQTSVMASEVSQWRCQAALKLIDEESNVFHWGSEGLWVSWGLWGWGEGFFTAVVVAAFQVGRDISWGIQGVFHIWLRVLLTLAGRWDLP